MNTKQPTVFRQDQKFNVDILLMCFPLVAMAVCFYGFRVLLLCTVAVCTANISDRIVALLRHQTHHKGEVSSETFALLLTLLMPATVDYYVVVAGSLATVLLAKEAFGGFAAYVFHPTAVGYAVVAACWPNQLFLYPKPNLFAQLPLWDASAVAKQNSATYLLREGGLPTVSTLDLLLGNYAGPMGATMLLVILACALYLVHRRRVRWQAPVAFLLTAAAIAFLFPRFGGVGALPWQHVGERLASVKFELCSAGVVFGAVYLLPDPVTLPKAKLAQLVYGFLGGVACMMFRYFGIFEAGVCFALLVLNPLSGWIDRVVSKLISRKRGVRREL